MWIHIDDKAIRVKCPDMGAGSQCKIHFYYFKLHFFRFEILYNSELLIKFSALVATFYSMWKIPKFTLRLFQ